MHEREVSQARFLVALTVLFIVNAPLIAASTAGPNSPSTMSTDEGIGTIEWDNPNDAKTSDNDHAKAELDDDETSEYLKATNFNMTLPSKSIIEGIQVDVERKVDSTSGGSIVRDASVRLVKGGTIQGADRATTTPYTTTDVTESHGDATDLWGLTWTPADITSSSFGVAFAATKANTNSNKREALVDHIRITVYYSLDITPPIIVLIGGNQTVSVGTTYTDPGATATDDVNGNITSTITANNTVNTNMLGTYNVTYRVNDSSGNNATATRTVTVIDTTPPVITLRGAQNTEHMAGTQYIDAGATAYDSFQGDLTQAIHTNYTMDFNLAGTYDVTYVVNDSSGNTAQASRVVTIIDDEGGLGKFAFSHFHPSSPATPSTHAPVASEPASPVAAAPTSTTPAPSQPPRSGESPLNPVMGASERAALSTGPQARENAMIRIAANPRTAPLVTGAVTGKGRTARWPWLLALVLFAIALFIRARLRRPKPYQKDHRRRIIDQLRQVYDQA